MANSPDVAGALERAKARLDPLGLYPRPVDISRVRVVHAPWFFRLPRLRRFTGFATHWTILTRHPLGKGFSEDLLTHELCHVWQLQHHPVHMPLTNLYSYERNPYEIEARRAARITSAATDGQGESGRQRSRAVE